MTIKYLLDSYIYVFGNLFFMVITPALNAIAYINHTITSWLVDNVLIINHDIPCRNNYPCILVPGIMADVKDRSNVSTPKGEVLRSCWIDYFEYWAPFCIKELFDRHPRKDGTQCLKCHTMSPLGSNKLKAIELFHYIYGGRPQTKKYFDKNVSSHRYSNQKGVHKKWSSKHKVHLLGHSQGSAVIRKLIIMLCNQEIEYDEKCDADTSKDLAKSVIIRKPDGKLYYNTHTNWVASYVSLSGCHYGSYLATLIHDYENTKFDKHVVGEQLMRYRFITRVQEMSTSMMLYINQQIKTDRMKRLWNWGYDLCGVGESDINRYGIFSCFTYERYFKNVSNMQNCFNGVTLDTGTKEAKEYHKCYEMNEDFRKIIHISVITKGVSDSNILPGIFTLTFWSLLFFPVRYNLVQSSDQPINDGILPFHTQQSVWSRENNIDVSNPNSDYFKHAHAKHYKHPIDIILSRTDHFTFIVLSLNSILNIKRVYYTYEYIYSMMKSIKKCSV